MLMTGRNNNKVSNAAMLVSKKLSLYLPTQTVLILSIGIVDSELTRFQVSLDIDCDSDNLMMYALTKRRHSLYLHSEQGVWRYEYDLGLGNTSELHPLLTNALVEFAFTLSSSLNDSSSLSVLSDHCISNFTITVNPHAMSINHIVDGHGYCISTDKNSQLILRMITQDDGDTQSDTWAVQNASHPTERAYNELFLMLAPLMNGAPKS